MQQISFECSRISTYFTHTLEAIQLKESLQKLGDVAKRCLQSPLFWAAVALTTVAIASIALAPFAPQVSFCLVAATLGICMPLINRYKKELMYEVSILPTIFYHAIWPVHYPWANQILPELAVSAIPLTSMNHHLQTGSNKAILTMLEEHELKPSIFSVPVTANIWRERTISHHTIPAPDFHGVALHQIREGVAFVREQILAGREVIVHCKAGRGRSATIAICYLLTHGEAHGLTITNIDQAVSFVKAKRHVIHINSRQLKAIESYLRN